MRAGAVKTWWHLLLVGASVIEWKIAQTDLKKHLAAACAGWHISAAAVDAIEWRRECEADRTIEVKVKEQPTEYYRGRGHRGPSERQDLRNS